jgi:hypothetical protein
MAKCYFITLDTTVNNKFYLAKSVNLNPSRCSLNMDYYYSNTEYADMYSLSSERFVDIKVTEFYVEKVVLRARKIYYSFRHCLIGRCI